MEDSEATNTTSTTSTGPASASPLFSFSKPGTSFGFGFGFDAAPTPSLLPPPPVEVLLSEVLISHLFLFLFGDSFNGLIFALLCRRSLRSLPQHGSQWRSMTHCRSTRYGCKLVVIACSCVRGNASGTFYSSVGLWYTVVGCIKGY
jgi:hypothetical protein